MRKIEKLSKLRDCIEEHSRASKKKGFDFIDPGFNIERIKNKKCQVIFGRRGAGKTTLLKHLNPDENCKYVILINVEDYKDHIYPDVLIQILLAFFKALIIFAKSKKGRKNFIKRIRIIKELKRTKKQFYGQLENPEEFEQEEKRGQESKTIGGLKATIKKVTGNLSKEKKLSEETIRKIRIRKIDTLRKRIPEVKELIGQVTELLDEEGIFLVLDDFYFLNKGDQPFVADYFHRVSKDNNLHLKLASIKYRSKLYQTTNRDNTIYGIETKHDVQVINLDHSLENFEILHDFMTSLLKQAIKKAGVRLSTNDIATENGFKYLCLASGGVPREFLSYTAELIQNIGIANERLITDDDVVKVAVNSYEEKFEKIRQQTFDETLIVEKHLYYLKTITVTQNRTNVFLMPNDTTNRFMKSKYIIKLLMDLRWLHLISKNIKLDGYKKEQTFSAYMLDFSTLINPIPNDFYLIDKFKDDANGLNLDVKLAPKINLIELNNFIKSDQNTIKTTANNKYRSFGG